MIWLVIKRLVQSLLFGSILTVGIMSLFFYTGEKDYLLLPACIPLGVWLFGRKINPKWGIGLFIYFTIFWLWWMYNHHGFRNLLEMGVFAIWLKVFWEYKNEIKERNLLKRNISHFSYSNK